ncbi:hypothetical protein HHE02_11260 [Helicobacter heilmannii]|uniref:hypothetical protein n=1 Tax=Helicobacter heilmannii TaxID=35817 RepID=UPI0006A1588D|nr:hypothetical protein [Helicobacter heilmannii]CRF47830.1 hypothetical protein HHE02_11260 [Helicobacter heilmannii]
MKKHVKKPRTSLSSALLASLSLSSLSGVDFATTGSSASGSTSNTANETQTAVTVNSISRLLGSSYTINTSGYSWQNTGAPAPIYNSVNATAPLTISNTPIGAGTSLNPNLTNFAQDLGWTIDYSLFPNPSQLTLGAKNNQQLAYGLLCSPFNYTFLFNAYTTPPFASRSLGVFYSNYTMAIQDIIQTYQNRLNFDGW